MTCSAAWIASDCTPTVDPAAWTRGVHRVDRRFRLPARADVSLGDGPFHSVAYWQFLRKLAPNHDSEPPTWDGRSRVWGLPPQVLEDDRRDDRTRRRARRLYR